MSDVAIIINVSNQYHSHANGLSGTWVVPSPKAGENFGLLVVYPTIEIQDIGDQRRVNHTLKARPIAKDIVGIGSDAAAHGQGVSGTKEKWGVLLCEATPTMPRELEDAIEAEIVFLNDHPPDVKYRRDPASKANVATNIEPPEDKEMKIKLSYAVRDLRTAFEQECRRLVAKAEVAKARRALLIEDQRLVAEGDRMWARPVEQINIHELHRLACTRLGQERPWSYIPQQLVDCPGCGSKIKENVLTCGHCGGWLDQGIEELREMRSPERARYMYPERYAEPATAGGKKS